MQPVSDELRLVMDVLARAPRDPSLLQQFIDDTGAESFAIPQGKLCLFGRERWDESVPADALSLARAVALTAGAVSLVSAKVLRGEALPAALVDAAVAALPPRGIGIDGKLRNTAGHCDEYRPLRWRARPRVACSNPNMP